MHVPDSMLAGSVCPVTAMVGVAGVGLAGYAAWKSAEKPSAARFGGVAALVFAAQMMNFPVQHGTSGHLLGGVLAAALLGVPFGVLAIALVLAVQCLVFADGGVTVLGANVVNMALLGAGLGGIMYKYFVRGRENSPRERALSAGVVACLSVLIAALACSLELAWAGTIPLGQVLVAMLGIHALIGIGEGILTAGAVYVVARVAADDRRPATSFALLGAAGVIGLLLSPLASGWPDGLEWVAAKYQFLHESAPLFAAPVPDYSVGLVSSSALATGLAGLLGVAVTFAAAWGIGRALRARA